MWSRYKALLKSGYYNNSGTLHCAWASVFFSFSSCAIEPKLLFKARDRKKDCNKEESLHFGKKSSLCIAIGTYLRIYIKVECSSGKERVFTVVGTVDLTHHVQYLIFFKLSSVLNWIIVCKKTIDTYLAVRKSCWNYKDLIVFFANIEKNVT